MDRWEPAPVPLGDGRHDIGDDARAAIFHRLHDDFTLAAPWATAEQRKHLAMFAAASVRALLHELGMLRDMGEPQPTRGYMAEVDGRRCVEHPQGDHELVCLTCLESGYEEQSQDLRTLAADLRHMVFDDPVARRVCLSAADTIDAATRRRTMTEPEAAQSEQTISQLRIALSEAEALAAAYKRDFDAELAGNAAMREKLGALPNETMGAFVDRLIAERAEAEARVHQLEAALRRISEVGAAVMARKIATEALTGQAEASHDTLRTQIHEFRSWLDTSADDARVRGYQEAANTLHSCADELDRLLTAPRGRIEEEKGDGLPVVRGARIGNETPERNGQ